MYEKGIFTLAEISKTTGVKYWKVQMILTGYFNQLRDNNIPKYYSYNGKVYYLKKIGSTSEINAFKSTLKNYRIRTFNKIKAIYE